MWSSAEGSWKGFLEEVEPNLDLEAWVVFEREKGKEMAELPTLSVSCFFQRDDND